ncbi:hypothetical protein, partial [Pseudomonas aeruginosa]
MSLNGRLKARAASFARTAYPPILGSLRRVPPPPPPPPP